MGMNFVFENSIEQARYKESVLTIDDYIDYFIGAIKECPLSYERR